MTAPAQELTAGQAAALAMARAARQVAEAEDACRNIPLTLPPHVYRRRLNAAMDAWRAANLALYGAQVAALPPVPGEAVPGA